MLRSRYVLLPWLFLSIFFLSRCGATLPVKMPRFPTGSTGEQLKSVMKGKRIIGIVALKPSEQVAREITYVDDWAGTLENRVSAELSSRGYFKIVDISNRKNRLQELAHTHTGLTSAQKAIGQEMAVDGLLYLNMTAPPVSECRSEVLSSGLTYGKAALQLGLAMAANVDTGKVEASAPTGVRYLTVFIQGKLVNIETGQSISYSHTKPYRLPGKVGNRDCPSELKAFHGALNEAAKELVDHLSPGIITMNVPLEKSVKDIPGDTGKVVKQHLENGIKWAKTGDFELAADSWKRALDISGGQSVSALWNLGAYYWFVGDFTEAERKFKQVMRVAGPDWMEKSSRRKLWVAFREEKRRRNQ